MTPASSNPPNPNRQALIVLVGITANRRKRAYLRHYFCSHSDYDVFVPDLPYRRPLAEAAAWYADYLANEIRPGRYDTLHCIAYIAGGALLHCLPASVPPMFERMVCFRGPYQERVAERLVARIGRWLGIRAADIPPAWSEAELLPGAEAALHIPRSHDDVYTDDTVLDAALHFIRHGRFPDTGHDHADPD